MNRKQKIIVSVVGITIVLLALLGITYAYYLTRIQGNTNTNSISVTTAKLELVYGDNSAEIIKGNGALTPNSDKSIGTKTFTVTNNGIDSSYVVIIDNVSITKVSDGTETSFVSNDFRYTLSCSVKDKSGNVLEDESCNNIETLSIFPIKGGILVGNDIPENRVHEYIFTLWYIDTGIDQSDDMGKSLQARINITDVIQMENPFSTGVTATDNASLAYNIINNSKIGKNGTTLKNEPVGKVGSEASAYPVLGLKVVKDTWYYADTPQVFFDGELLGYEGTTCTVDLIGKYVTVPTSSYIWGKEIKGCEDGYPIIEGYVTENERTLSIAQDDLGMSYYFRGDVLDNYVNFAGMCWKIVRIEGDGSVKLILEDAYATCDDNETTLTSEVYTGNWNIVTGATANIGYDDLVVDDATVSTIPNYLSSQKDYQNSMSYKYLEWQKTLAKKIDSDITDSSTTSQIDTVLKSKLKSGNWCYDDLIYEQKKLSSYTQDELIQKFENESFDFDPYIRLTIFTSPSSTLKCNGTLLSKFDDDRDGIVSSTESNMYVGSITMDEVVHAGYYLSTMTPYADYFGYEGPSDGKNYLINDEFSKGTSGVIKSSHFLTNSLRSYESSLVGIISMYAYNTIDIENYYLGVVGALRPSISIKSGVTITSGDGTQTNPYVIE